MRGWWVFGLDGTRVWVCVIYCGLISLYIIEWFKHSEDSYNQYWSLRLC